jgi:hypothetical protein
MTPDGSWELFPGLEDIHDFPVCSRNVAIVEILSPGDSQVRHLRLADPCLGLNTTVHRYDGVPHRNGGYNFLAGSGPHTIRANWTIVGCVASDKLKPYRNLSVITAHSFCVPTSDIVQQFVTLQSAPLNLTANLPRP